MNGPTIGLTGSGVVALAGMAVGAVVLVYVLRRLPDAGAVARAAERVNPASPNNFVYSGVSWAGQAVTGDEGWSLGGQLAEWFSPSVRAANASLNAALPARSGTGYAVTTPWLSDYDETARLVARYGSAPDFTGGATGSW